MSLSRSVAGDLLTREWLSFGPGVTPLRWLDLPRGGRFGGLIPATGLFHVAATGSHRDFLSLALRLLSACSRADLALPRVFDESVRPLVVRDDDEDFMDVMVEDDDEVVRVSDDPFLRRLNTAPTTSPSFQTLTLRGGGCEFKRCWSLSLVFSGCDFDRR